MSIILIQNSFDSPYSSTNRSLIILEIHFRREKLRQGLLRKKKCETKALSLVEQFISEKVDRESFREAVSLGMVYE